MVSKPIIIFGIVFLLLASFVFAVTLTRDATERIVVPLVARGEICPWDEATRSCTGPNEEVVFGNADVYSRAGDIVTLFLVVFDNHLYRSTSFGVDYSEGTVAPGGECCDFSNRYVLFESGGCAALGSDTVGLEHCPSSAAAGLECCNVNKVYYEYVSDGCDITYGADPALESVDLSYCGVEASGPNGLRGKLSIVNNDGTEQYTTGDTIVYSDEKGTISEEEPMGQFYVKYSGLTFESADSPTRRIFAESYEDLVLTLYESGEGVSAYKLQSVVATAEDLEWAPGCVSDADCESGQVCDGGGCRNI